MGAEPERERHVGVGHQRGPDPLVGHGINLLDFGTIRVFAPRFVGGVIMLYESVRDGDEAKSVAAYESWGFRNLKRGSQSFPSGRPERRRQKCVQCRA